MFSVSFEETSKIQVKLFSREQCLQCYVMFLFLAVSPLPVCSSLMCGGVGGDGGGATLSLCSTGRKTGRTKGLIRKPDPRSRRLLQRILIKGRLLWSSLGQELGNSVVRGLSWARRSLITSESIALCLNFMLDSDKCSSRLLLL